MLLLSLVIEHSWPSSLAKEAYRHPWLAKMILDKKIQKKKFIELNHCIFLAS